MATLHDTPGTLHLSRIEPKPTAAGTVKFIATTGLMAGTAATVYTAYKSVSMILKSSAALQTIAANTSKEVAAASGDESVAALNKAAAVTKSTQSIEAETIAKTANTSASSVSKKATVTEIAVRQKATKAVLDQAAAVDKLTASLTTQTAAAQGIPLGNVGAVGMKGAKGTQRAAKVATAATTAKTATSKGVQKAFDFDYSTERTLFDIPVRSKSQNMQRAASKAFGRGTVSPQALQFANAAQVANAAPKAGWTGGAIVAGAKGVGGAMAPTAGVLGSMAVSGVYIAGIAAAAAGAIGVLDRFGRAINSTFNDGLGAGITTLTDAAYGFNKLDQNLSGTDKAIGYTAAALSNLTLGAYDGGVALMKMIGAFDFVQGKAENWMYGMKGIKQKNDELDKQMQEILTRRCGAARKPTP